MIKSGETFEPRRPRALLARRSLATTSSRRLALRVCCTVVAVAGACLLLIPFWWMLRTSLMTMGDIFLVPIRWIPIHPQFGNFPRAWSASSYGQLALNSTIVTVLATAGTVVSSSVTAYGFARLRAPGRNILFFAVLSALMIPSTVVLVPTYLLFRALGWLNTYLPLIVPWWFGGGAFSIFLLRQFFRTIPRELDEAAMLDGAGYSTTYLRIILPLAWPGHAAVAIFSFLLQWNEFFAPLIYLNDSDKYTIPVGLQGFVGAYSTIQWNYLMAGALLAMLPCLAIFFIAQRYFVRGITMTGVTG